MSGCNHTRNVSEYSTLTLYPFFYVTSLCVDRGESSYREWKSLRATIKKFQNSLKRGALSFAFSFVEVCMYACIRSKLHHVTGIVQRMVSP